MHEKIESRDSNDMSLENIEKVKKDLEEAMTFWVESLRILDEKVPHDDVLIDGKTMSYHVIRNAWLANLYELDKLRGELKDLSQGILPN